MFKYCFYRLCFSICFTILLTFIAGSAFSMELKIATISPDGSPWMLKMRQSAKEIAAKTDGRVQFKFYPGGIMGNDKAVLRKIRFGQLHGGVLTGGSLSKSFSDAQVYSLPLKFRSLAEIDYVRTRMDSILIEGYDRGGFVTFGLAEGGFAYVMSNSPVGSIEELRNQKVWIPDHDLTVSESMQAFGIKPIPLPITDVRAGLQTGLIDTVAGSPLGAIILQWHTQVKYVTEMPLVYIFGLLALDKKAFAKISPEDQEVVHQTMKRTWQEINQQNRADNVEALTVLNKLGIEFIKPGDAEIKEWFAVADGVTRRLVDAGVISRQMVEMLDNLLADYRARSPEKNE